MRFLLLALWLSAYAAAPKKIVVIGDSLTEGYGVAHDHAYPALLQKKIDQAGKNWMVINSGISGSTSASAASRVTWHLKQKPDLILIALGANDGLRGTPAKSIEQNLSEALALCKKAGVKVILAGILLPPNYGAEYTRQFAAIFPALAKKQGVPLIPFLLENVAGNKDLNQGDGIHPNEKGHAIIAETVFRALQKEL